MQPSLTTTDPLLAHAVRAGGRGKRSQWVMASMAHALGRKTRDTQWASTLANSLSISVDTVYWNTFGYSVFLSLRREPVISEIFENLLTIRRRLSIKHFVLLGRAWKKYEFSPETAMSYLVTAAEEGVSAGTMQVFIEGIEEAEIEPNQPDEWIGHFENLRKLANSHSNDLGIPDQLRWATLEYIDVIDQHLGGFPLDPPGDTLD